MIQDREKILALLKSTYPFRTMEEPRLDLIIDRLQQVDYNDGDLIYDPGAISDKLFIVLNSKVRVTQMVQGKEELLANVESGEIFGFDALETNVRRLVRARAVGAVRLLFLDRENLKLVLRQTPKLDIGLEIMLHSYHLGLKTPLKWRDPGESIYFIARRHPYYLWKRIAGVALFAFVTLVPLILFYRVSPPEMVSPRLFLGLDMFAILALLVWNYFDWTNDYSIITSKRVVFQEKVVALYDSRTEAPLSAIQSIDTDTDQIGRWLLFGDVVVRTYAGAIRLAGVRRPQQVARLLEDQWFRARENLEREEMEIAMGEIRTRLGLEETAAAETAKTSGKPSSKNKRVTSLAEWLANLFQMRYESDGIITYRTHWFILIERIWLPSLLLLALTLLLFSSLLGIFTLISLTAVLSILLVFGTVVLGWWLYQYVDWRNDYYQITKDQVVDVYKKPLGKEERAAAPIKNILSIDYERRGIIGLVLNFGVVNIRVGEARLTFDDVYNPSEVQRELFKRIAEREYNERVKQIAGDRDRVISWIEAYHRVVENQEHENPSSPDEFSE
jgi:hypothetical protein